MSNLNNTERHLAGWRPRPASDRIRPRLFSSPERDAPRTTDWNWLAPALACFVLLSGALTGGNASIAYLPVSDTNAAKAALMSGAAYGAYLAASSHSGQNRIGLAVIEWTNNSAEDSSETWTIPAETNVLTY